MRDELKSILLMPIISGKEHIKIDLDKGIIETTGSKDPDMSDIAIKFYEILYGFDEGEMFPYEMYAGDTMNSCNTVTRFASREVATDLEECYHCLANFWVLPKAVGRNLGRLAKASGGRQTNTVKSFNQGRRDYMDRFLKQYIELKADYSNLYAKYTNRFPLSSFAEKHYLTNVYMKDMIKDRAVLISESNKADELLNCFNKYIY